MAEKETMTAQEARGRAHIPLRCPAQLGSARHMRTKREAMSLLWDLLNDIEGPTSQERYHGVQDVDQFLELLRDMLPRVRAEWARTD